MCILGSSRNDFWKWFFHSNSGGTEFSCDVLCVVFMCGCDDFLVFGLNVNIRVDYFLLGFCSGNAFKMQSQKA